MTIMVFPTCTSKGPESSQGMGVILDFPLHPSITITKKYLPETCRGKRNHCVAQVSQII